MMYNRKNPHPILWMILLIITLFSILSYTIASAHQATPELSARSAALYEPSTNSFLFEKNARQRLPMASTTKIITALVAIENSSLTDTVVIDKIATNIEGSSAYLKEGEVLTMEELLYSLLLGSANDSAVAIACHISGGVEGFSELMNKKAEDLGLFDTSFKNPHGLDNPDHYTTAHDLAIIAAEAMKNEKFKEIVGTYKKSFKSEERSRTYVNHNKLLLKYSDCIGVKTGYTKKSGRCLVGAAEKEGLSFIAVTLDDPCDWNDHKELFDYGFSLLEKRVLCNEGDFSFELPVIGAESDSVTVRNHLGFSYITKNKNEKVESRINLKKYLIAPIKKGDKVGEVLFTVDGKEVGSVDIFCDDNINKKEEKGFFRRIFKKTE